jgi:hypothetical protein
VAQQQKRRTLFDVLFGDEPKQAPRRLRRFHGGRPRQGA